MPSIENEHDVLAGAKLRQPDGAPILRVQREVRSNRTRNDAAGVERWQALAVRRTQVGTLGQRGRGPERSEERRVGKE